MFKFKKLLFLIFLFTTSIFSQDKLSFSALSVQGKTINGQKVEIFKNNVVVEYKGAKLYSDVATHYKDKKKVVMENGVKMIEGNDSLTCNNLSIFDNEKKRYEAEGNVSFYQVDRKLNCNNLIYWSESKNILAYNNAQISDSLRTISGDSLYLNYKNSQINNIQIKSSSKIISTKNIKIAEDSPLQPVEDLISGDYMYLNFDENEKISNINVIGMSKTEFNTERNKILQGQNHVSGDTIHIAFDTQKSDIDNIIVKGGVIGNFYPEKNNSDISSVISYLADKIEYDINKETSLLTDNAKIIYEGTELLGGEIFADWNNNIVESNTKDNVYPQISSDGSEPMAGAKMIFDLTTKEGTINEGYTNADIGVFKGNELLQNDNDELFIKESSFTSCDLDTPHYYFGSKEMLVKKEDKIIARPMVVYIHDFPVVGVPFAILPHSTNKRKSGLLMPSFGHSSSRGTYVKDLGFYVAPNDYFDFDFMVDFYDRRYVNVKSKIRYNKLYGNRSYNYRYSGFFSIDKFRVDLIDGEEDIQYLDEENKTTELKTIKFYHNQNFDPTQSLIIDYIYKSDRLDTNEININELLNQNLTSRLSYSKSWDNGSSLTLGFNEFKKLNLPEAENFLNNQINYKNNSGSLVYNLSTRKLFGNGDQWFNDIYLSYNLNFNSDRKDYYKSLNVLIDTLSQQESYSLSDSSVSTYGGLRQTVDISLSSTLPGKMEWLNITPSITMHEDWIYKYAMQSEDDASTMNDFQRRLLWDVGVYLKTTLYGIFPSKIKNLESIRHILQPWMRISYRPESHSSETDYFSGTSLGSYPTGYFSSSFGIKNNFQIKTGNKDNGYNAWDILKWNLNTTYNFDTKFFSNIVSDISLSGPPDGNEYFSLYMSHSLYSDENKTILIKPEKGENPKLEILRMSMSRTFNLNLSGDKLSNDDLKNKTSAWESALGFTLRADYNLEDDWVFRKFLKSASTIYLTQKWKINLNADFNLDTMEIELLSLKFYRPLHCWEFSFDMNPVGWNKGFVFKLSIIEPGLNDIKIRQSNKRVY